MSKVYNIVGKKFGRLKVLSRIIHKQHKRSFFLCECECGTLYVVSGRHLVVGDTRSCGCLHRECAGNLTKLRPYESLYKGIKHHTKHAVTLTYEEFLDFTKEKECHYCRASITWSLHNTRNSSAYNLDRKNNSKGYSKENCVVCCKRCNFGKGSLFTYDEWYGMTKFFRNGGVKWH